MTFHSIPLVVACPALLLIFLAAAYGGATAQRRHGAGGGDSTSIVITAASSLLGLLIAFTFSIALGRYEVRRDLIVREATAVRNVVHRAALLPVSANSEIVAQTRDYLNTRIAFETDDPSITRSPRAREATVHLQEKLWLTAVSLPANNGPLLDALTELFSTADSRASANAETIPNFVLAIVILISAAISAIIGFATGLPGIAPPRLPVLIYVTVLALALTLILDLDRPTRGGVRVSTAPFLELLER